MEENKVPDNQAKRNESDDDAIQDNFNNMLKLMRNDQVYKNNSMII